MTDLGSCGTGACEVHELAQSQGVQAGDVKLHLLPRAAGQAGVAGMHQRHRPLKLLGGQALQCWQQGFLHGKRKKDVVRLDLSQWSIQVFPLAKHAP